MREVITTICVYPFNQLKEDIQDEVIEKFYDINVDYEWWKYDGLLELTKEEIENSNLTETETEYIHNTCLFVVNVKAFDLNRDRYIQIDVAVTSEKIFRKFLGISSELWDICDYQFITDNGHYNTRFEISHNDLNEKFTTTELDTIELAEELMYDKIHKILYDLQDSYEYLTSRESIIETIKANEFEFTKNGNLF